MMLWVRSQNRVSLGLFTMFTMNRVLIQQTWSYGYVISGITAGGVDKELGLYTTEARAIAVLGEIEAALGSEDVFVMPID